MCREVDPQGSSRGQTPVPFGGSFGEPRLAGPANHRVEGAFDAKVKSPNHRLETQLRAFYEGQVTAPGAATHPPRRPEWTFAGKSSLESRSIAPGAVSFCESKTLGPTSPFGADNESARYKVHPYAARCSSPAPRAILLASQALPPVLWPHFDDVFTPKGSVLRGPSC